MAWHGMAKKAKGERLYMYVIQMQIAALVAIIDTFQLRKDRK